MNSKIRWTALALAAILAAGSLTACGGSGSGEAATNEAEESETMNVSNPFVDCESAYDASQLAGFEVTFPESVPGYSERFYQAIEGELVQCFYSEGESKVLIRKAIDDGSGDISGDYNEYGETTKVTVGDVEVTVRGDGGTVSVAIWTRGEYAFAIDADEGLDSSVVEQLVAETL